MTTIEELGRILDAPIPRDEFARRSTAQRFIDGGASDLLDMVGLGEFS